MGKNTFLQDFKAFAMKGNVIDMAVGVVIGGAFGKIVSSLVANVIMPPIGLLVGGGSLNVKKALMCLSPIRRQRDCMMVRIHVIPALMCLTGLLSSISQGILCMDMFI